MSLKLYKLALVTALGASTLALGNTQASAFPIQPAQQSAQTDIVPVQFNSRGGNRGQMNMRGPMNWQMQRDGNRCRTRGGNCQHYHRGYYYQNTWWLLPFVIGSVAANSSYGQGSHAGWCQSKYRSYDVRTNSWLGKSGRRYQCNSPY